MNKMTIFYIVLVGAAVYSAITNALILFGQANGMTAMLYFPQAPINDQTIVKLKIVPQVIELAYIGVTMIYFINKKWE